jgi:hypothetical protein
LVTRIPRWVITSAGPRSFDSWTINPGGRRLTGATTSSGSRHCRQNPHNDIDADPNNAAQGPHAFTAASPFSSQLRGGLPTP